MKRIIKYLLVFLLIVTATACGNGGGNNKPVNFSRYASFVMHKDEQEIEFVAKLDDHNSIVDCAFSFDAGTPKDYYFGMSCYNAFATYFENVKNITKLNEDRFDLHVEQEYRSEFEEKFDELKNGIKTNAEIQMMDDNKDYFEKRFSACEDAMASFDGNNSNQPGGEPSDDTDGVVDIKTATSKGYVEKDNDTYVINMNKISERVLLNASECRIDFQGTLPCKGAVEIYNAAQVDLTNISFDAGGDFNNSELTPITIKDTSYKDVVFGNNVVPREEINLPPTENFLFAGISDDGKEIKVEINHMSEEDIEAQKQKDIDYINYVFENGVYKSEDGGSYGDICVDLDLNVGDVVLPNSDYSPICVGGNAKVKISGTLTVTGGSLRFEIRDNAELDLSDLYLIKSHPSFEMAFINYPEGYKGDKELLKAKTTKGKIEYEVSETRLKINIW